MSTTEGTSSEVAETSPTMILRAAATRSVPFPAVRAPVSTSWPALMASALPADTSFTSTSCPAWMVTLSSVEVMALVTLTLPSVALRSTFSAALTSPSTEIAFFASRATFPSAEAMSLSEVMSRPASTVRSPLALTLPSLTIFTSWPATNLPLPSLAATAPLTTRSPSVAVIATALALTAPSMRALFFASTIATLASRGPLTVTSLPARSSSV